jgi:uncharacterized membrane protein YfcA
VLAVDFSALDYVLASLAALGAGIVNALAGGGTLISFPALMALGATNVGANVTNTVALCPGYLGGAYAQRASLAGDTARLRVLCGAAGIGGLTGSVLLVSTDEKLFEQLIPWMILTACALLGGQNYIKRALRIGASPDVAAGSAIDGMPTGAVPAERSPVVAGISIFVVSIYGGYFGAGLGIMMLAVLGLLYSDTLNRLNAHKQALSLVVNVTAALFFVWTGKVYWGLALAMAPASLLGGWCGGRLADVISGPWLRRVVVTYGTVLAFYYLLR